jgi:micrococcal nuclease
VTRRRAIAISTILTAALSALVSLLYTQTKPFTWPEAPAITPGFYAITQVVDGDTIEIDMAGQREKIRMIGVDTPETKKPDSPVQCFGPQASDFAKKTLTGKSVRLEADPTNDNRDRYGRLLRYVYLQDGTLFEEMLITQGYGFAYTLFAFQKKEAFTKLQERAQTAKAGLWAACTTTLSGQKWQTNDQ